MIYLDTRSLVEFVMNATNKPKEEAAEWAFEQSKISKFNRSMYVQKFASGKFIGIMPNAANNLKTALAKLAKKTETEYREWQVFFPKLPKGAEFITGDEMWENIREEKKAANTSGTVNSPSDEIFKEILTELKAIRELNEDTCSFIKTLVIALNGEPKAKINPANK